MGSCQFKILTINNLYNLSFYFEAIFWSKSSHIYFIVNLRISRTQSGSCCIRYEWFICLTADFFDLTWLQTDSSSDESFLILICRRLAKL